MVQWEQWFQQKQAFVQIAVLQTGFVISMWHCSKDRAVLK